MATRQTKARREAITPAGEILISSTHLALLYGLHAHPGGTAPSYSAWIRASLPFAAKFRRNPSSFTLGLAIRSVHPRWVVRVRRDRRVEVRLTRRGRMIVERQLPARIRGWGRYEGLDAIECRPARAEKPISPAVVPEPSAATVLMPRPDVIREAVAFADIYGIPLLEREGAKENDAVLYAVTVRLERAFILKTREELELRGPRRWHVVWTRAEVERNRIPAGYREIFSEYDSEDVLSYLRELIAEDRDKDLYCHTYGGRQFLSSEKLQEWLSEEIDLTQTDIDQADLVPLIRGLSETHVKVKAAIADFGTECWKHPDTGKCVGHVFCRDRHPGTNTDLVVTTSAALSCLQSLLDSLGLGVRIETCYLLPEDAWRRDA